jgi:hypothetical protein
MIEEQGIEYVHESEKSERRPANEDGFART